jgi:ribonuclease Z
MTLPKFGFKRLLVIMALLGLGLFAALKIHPVQDWVLARLMNRQFAQNQNALFEKSAMRIIFCGTAAPPPSPGKAKACTIIIAGGKFLVFDAGPKSAENIARWRLPMQKIDGLFLTHFHSDHIGEVGEMALLSWAQGKKVPLPLYGPDGVEQVAAGFNLAYAHDRDHRRTHHGAALAQGGGLVARPFGLADAASRQRHDASAVVFNSDGVKVTAFQVMHEPVYPAVGYRIDYRGRSVVITGDTAQSENLIRQARNADVLIAEAQAEAFRKPLASAAMQQGEKQIGKLMRDIQSYHITPPQAAEIADRANNPLLAITHQGPLAPTNWFMRDIFMRGVERKSGDILVADDGDMIILPADNKTITITEISQ